MLYDDAEPQTLTPAAYFGEQCNWMENDKKDDVQRTDQTSKICKQATLLGWVIMLSGMVTCSVSMSGTSETAAGTASGFALFGMLIIVWSRVYNWWHYR